MLNNSASQQVSIASSVLSLNDKVTTLGVILDSNLTLDAHVSAVFKNADFHLRALRHIRSSLTDDMATSIAVALIHSRQLVSLWYFCLKHPQTPALSEHGRPSHLTTVIYSFCSIHHGSVSLAPNQHSDRLQNRYPHLQHFVFWPSGIPS